MRVAPAATLRVAANAASPVPLVKLRSNVHAIAIFARQSHQIGHSREHFLHGCVKAAHVLQGNDHFTRDTAWHAKCMAIRMEPALLRAAFQPARELRGCGTAICRFVAEFAEPGDHLSRTAPGYACPAPAVHFLVWLSLPPAAVPQRPRENTDR
jgi:hypothetical protein